MCEAYIVQIEKIAAEENPMNQFLAPEDKIGDEYEALVLGLPEKIYGHGKNKKEAIDDLKENVRAYFAAKAAEVNLGIEMGVRQLVWES